MLFGSSEPMRSAPGFEVPRTLRQRVGFCILLFGSIAFHELRQVRHADVSLVE